VAARVLDDQSRISLSVTAVGPSGYGAGRFDANTNGAIALSLKQAGMALSKRMAWAGHLTQ
jgi:hypothetical protein